MMEEIFIALGAVILFGFFGRAAYDRTKVPESILMIVIGLLIGPGMGFVKPDLLMPAVPFISVLALILVLLDAGLEFDLFGVFRGFPSALAFTLLVSASVTALVGAALHLFLGWEPMHALFIGLICSGTTTVAAMTLLELANAQERTKNFLFLETVINDFTLIFGASIILSIIGGGGIGGDGAGGFVSAITIAATLGIVFGFAWIGALRRIGRAKYKYIASVGALFLIYGLSEAVGGNGMIATLIFSFVLGNHTGIFRKFRVERNAPAVREERRIITGIRFIHGDISFVIRIFFFVLIGAVFRFENLTPEILLIASAIILMIFIGRYFSLRIVGMADRDLIKDEFTIVTMIPRGFVATVLAFIPAGMGITIPSLTEIVLLLVLSTNIIAVAACSYNARANARGETAAAPDAPSPKRARKVRKLDKRD